MTKAELLRLLEPFTDDCELRVYEEGQLARLYHMQEHDQSAYLLLAGAASDVVVPGGAQLTELT